MDLYRTKLIKENDLLREKIKEIQAANQEIIKKTEERLAEQAKEKVEKEKAIEEYKKKKDERDALLALVNSGVMSPKNLEVSEMDRWIKNLKI